MVASLVFAPEASASPVRGMQLPGDPPTLPEIGDPEVPVNPGPSRGITLWTCGALVPLPQLVVVLQMRVVQKQTVARCVRASAGARQTPHGR
jgi:hypothetical protein